MMLPINKNIIIKPKQTSGDRAKKAGLNQENMISNFLGDMEERGLNFEWKRLNPRRKEDCVGESIYGLPIWTDFLVNGIKGYEDGFYIESKYQSVAGSGDEKFPYLYENIVNKFPLPTIVVLTLEPRIPTPGLTYRFGKIYNWWNEKVKEHHASGGKKLIAVKTIHQFQNWFEEQIGFYDRGY